METVAIARQRRHTFLSSIVLLLFMGFSLSSMMPFWSAPA
jgi:hypothetical protein